MHFEFDAKIDQVLRKSLKAAIRAYKEQESTAAPSGITQAMPSYEEFLLSVDNFSEASKRVELNKLRTPTLRELFEHTWSQKLRNYATQEQFRKAYEAIVRRYRTREKLARAE